MTSFELEPLLTSDESESTQHESESHSESSHTGVPTAGLVHGPRDHSDAGRMTGIAQKLVDGSMEVHDIATELSDGQRDIVSALVQQARLMDQLRIQAEQIEADREQQLEDEIGPPVELTSLVTFQPEYKALPAQDDLLIAELKQAVKHLETSKMSAIAATELVERLGGAGLVPADQLKGVALSGDDTKAKVVSVNVLPRRKEAARVADFATYSSAGGAVPIAIEQYGDIAKVNKQVLATRAAQSAVYVIDPAKLDLKSRNAVQQSAQGGGGEVGLDKVPTSAFVTVLAPVAMAGWINVKDVERYHIQFVGNAEKDVYFAGTKEKVRITHPDYASALLKIFEQNGEKTLLTHTTRLGAPNPII